VSLYCFGERHNFRLLRNNNNNNNNNNNSQLQWKGASWTTNGRPMGSSSVGLRSFASASFI